MGVSVITPCPGDPIRPGGAVNVETLQRVAPGSHCVTRSMASRLTSTARPGVAKS